ncbi:MAG: PilZ domain-containing protein [Phycisphaerales bacterium]|nr:PilZ domain-containing protein [Phycisphaerales bacterium]
MSIQSINRRQHERFLVNPGYTSTCVRIHPDEETFTRSGHIYDLSEGGVCFELDIPIEPGSTVSMQIDLPGLAGPEDIGPGRAVFVTGNVVWCDIEEPGAAKMALAITRYDRAGDKERLIRALSANRFLRAA